MITIIMPYFNNGNMLLRHIQEWNQYIDPENYQLILADDCSQIDPLTNYLHDLKKIPFSSILAFRIKTDIPWNQDGARNLCFHHLSDGWCVSTDMDHLLKKESAHLLFEFIRNRKLSLTEYFRFRRSDASNPDVLIEKSHPNSYLIHKKLYWDVGGYEEKLAGLYGKDANFKRRLEIYGKDCGILPDQIHLIRYTSNDIKDANTTIYGRKDSIFHVRNHEGAIKISVGTDKPEYWLNFEWEQLC